MNKKTIFSLAVLFFLVSPSMGDIEVVEGREITQSRKIELLQLLRQDCGSCHGMTMKGGLGTPLLPEYIRYKPTAYLVDRVLNGVPETAMPPWKPFLKKSEATWIVETLKKGI